MQSASQTFNLYEIEITNASEEIEKKNVKKNQFFVDKTIENQKKY